MKTILWKLRIFLALFFAVIVSYVLFVGFQPKLNDDIPVQPLSLKVDLTQNPDNTLKTRSINIIHGYAPDYQTTFDSNYYSIIIKNDDKVLFEGQTIKSYIMIRENFSGEDLEGGLNESPLGDFSLQLPYFEEATELVISDDTGVEALRINLSEENLDTPETQKTCGDGICSDQENVFMCYRDCSLIR